MEGELAPVLIRGRWCKAASVGRFQARDQATGEAFGEAFPVSGADAIEAALCAAVESVPALASAAPESIAAFLDAYAAGIEANAEALVAVASRETALPARTPMFFVTAAF